VFALSHEVRAYFAQAAECSACFRRAIRRPQVELFDESGFGIRDALRIWETAAWEGCRGMGDVCLVPAAKGAVPQTAVRAAG